MYMSQHAWIRNIWKSWQFDLIVCVLMQHGTSGSADGRSDSVLPYMQSAGQLTQAFCNALTDGPHSLSEEALYTALNV